MVPVLLNSGVAASTVLQTDTITVQLRNATDPSMIAASFKSVLSTSGAASCVFPVSITGGSYWIVVRHRNSLEIWSASTVAITSNASYDFTNAATNAYGNNLSNEGAGVFAIYAGGLNGDNYVDNFDYPGLENACLNFISGYDSGDMNGDGYTDNVDYPLLENGTLGFLMSIVP